MRILISRGAVAGIALTVLLATPAALVSGPPSQAAPTPTPPLVPTATAEAAETPDLSHDMPEPDLPPRPDDAAGLKRATNGWNPLSKGYRWKARPTYKLRLANVGGRNAAALRNAFTRLTTTLPNVDIHVAPGTVARHAVKKGEILVSIATESECDSLGPGGNGGAWVACGAPKHGTWVPGSNYTRAWINAGRIWIHPDLLNTHYTKASQYSVFQHEMGHVLGMGHFDARYDGTYQIMRSSGALPRSWRSGDKNGLRSARAVEKGWSNFRVSAVSATRVGEYVWQVGADVYGNVWVRRPKADGTFIWQDLDGVVRGTPAMVVTANRVFVFGVGAGGDLYQRAFNRSARTWGPWSRQAAIDWIGGVSAVLAKDGGIHIFGRRADRSAAQVWRPAAGSWAEHSLGGTLVGDPAALYLRNSNAYSLWGVGTDGRVHQQDYTGSWSGWFPVAGSPTTWKGSLDVELSNGRMYNVLGLNAFGDIIRATWRSGVGWKYSKRDTPTLRGRLDVVRVPSTDRLKIHAVDTAGRIRGSRQVDGGWTSFSVIPPR